MILACIAFPPIRSRLSGSPSFPSPPVETICDRSSAAGLAMVWSSYGLVLHRHVARVGFLAVHNPHDMRRQQRVTFVIEPESAATALEADLGQRITNRRAIRLGRRLNGQDGHGDGVIGFGGVGVRYT